MCGCIQPMSSPMMNKMLGCFVVPAPCGLAEAFPLARWVAAPRKNIVTAMTSIMPARTADRRIRLLRFIVFSSHVPNSKGRLVLRENYQSMWENGCAGKMDAEAKVQVASPPEFLQAAQVNWTGSLSGVNSP